MKNSKAILVVVCGVGIAIGYAISSLTSEQPPTASPGRNLEITATFDDKEVEELRESGFNELDSIEEVLQLPSMFARSEATYALAGRSTGSTVQQLIFEAHEIADPFERELILNVLFSRLTEIDADAALATARIEPFSLNQSAETSVWRTWARVDLESAIDAALAESQSGKRSRIAQIFFRSLGYTGTEETDLVESWLGIAPDRNTISQYIISLADQSPMLAIDYINEQASPIWQSQFASTLGAHLALSGVHEARQYKDSFSSRQAKNSYEQSLATAEAMADPVATLENLLAGGSTMTNQIHARNALASIAESDLHLALSYYDRIESLQLRQWLGTTIAQQMAADDIDAALQWAKENDTTGRQGLETAVLRVMAQSDPDRAFEEIRSRLNSEQGLGPAAGVLMAIARVDPQRAFGRLSEFEDSQTHKQLKSMVFGQWMSTAPEDAIDWALGQSGEEAELYLSNPGFVAHQDVNRAIQLLPRLPASVSTNWRIQIAASLASTRSLDEAMTFARSYSDKPGYESMLAGIAQSSVLAGPEAVMAVVDEIGDSGLRDQAYTNIVQRVMQRDPLQAIDYVDRIRDGNARAQVGSMSTRYWYQTDPTQAVRWINAKAPGKERDTIVAMVAPLWTDPTPQEQQLLDAVSDPQTRSQILVGRISIIARSDPAKAREMLRNGSFSENERRSIELAIERYSQPRLPTIYN